jgi:hypothetical protein
MSRDYHRARADILEAMPGTVPDLAKRSGYARGTVKRWIAELRKGRAADRGAHIGDWLEPEGRGAVAVAVWHAGPGKHKHRRRRGNASSQEKHARAVEQHGRELLAAKAANRYHARKRRAGHTDPLLGALFKQPTQEDQPWK